MPERIPPNNQEAEKSVLAACLVKEDAIIEVAANLKPEDFFNYTHREIYKAMLKLCEEHVTVDMVNLSEEVRRTGAKVELAKIVEIANFYASDDLQRHMQIVKDNAYLRRFISVSSTFVNRCYEKDYENLAQFKSEIEDQMLSLNQDQTGKIVSAREVLNYHFDEIMSRKKSDPKGIKTHLSGLDCYLSGIQATDFVIIAARPSVGKTAFALQIAAKNALDKKPVFFVTLEMSKEQIAERMLINLSGIDGKKLKIGELDPGEEKTLSFYLGKLTNAPIYLDEYATTVADIRAKARRLKNTKGLSLIIIDYLQLMEAKAENRTQEVTKISRGLKLLAKELQVPVIALSQLNRASESKADKKPGMSELRESGALEQDADIIMLLHRPDREKQDAEIILAKHRNGPIGAIPCKYDAKIMRFYETWVQEAQVIERTGGVEYAQ
ncbi:replicative DNA helicase [Thermanaerosceptrum fracticalcis]|uniref:Replicative DNA helicase n=1 Tax=Thermanaerosceptrum fracticalcis TaxID=1712410 RepID=A0A7G6E1A4_THEFR|nr:replicative DNA helicase [Thermanaerosceptrum fracticalcis]QNB45858.1 replicative DNA helicase [Thermanaerosceptrum fracticalcis]